VNVASIEWGYENAMALVDSALGRDEEANEVRESPKQAAIMKIVATVMQILNSGAKSVDRDTVHTAMGYRPERRHWKDADHVLLTVHGLTMNRGQHGKISYERK